MPITWKKHNTKKKQQKQNRILHGIFLARCLNVVHDGSADFGRKLSPIENGLEIALSESSWQVNHTNFDRRVHATVPLRKGIGSTASIGEHKQNTEKTKIRSGEQTLLSWLRLCLRLGREHHPPFLFLVHPSENSKPIKKLDTNHYHFLKSTTGA